MSAQRDDVKGHELHAQIQYRLMEELSASERRYRELVERIREVVFKCTADGRISYLNNAWRQILGYPVEASLGHQMADYLCDVDREVATALITREFEPGKGNEGKELRFRRSDGSLIWLMLTVQRGETEGRVGSLQNVHERKVAEQALKRVNEELEHRVEERTRALADSNEQLALEIEKRKTAQEELLKAERLAVVGETSGRVAHEVLNPITGIGARVEHNLQKHEELNHLITASREIWNDWKTEYDKGTFLEYLSTAGKDGVTYGDEDFDLFRKLLETQSRFQNSQFVDLRFVRKQLERVTKIINSLRESVITWRDVKPFDIGIAIKEAHEVLADSLAKRRIEAVFHIPGDIPAVTADESEMVQTFINLFRNAMQGIDEKGAHRGLIETTVCEVDDQLEIRVRDDGVGIPEHARRSIFGFDFSTKAKDEGTGLGLGISRRFVRANGGDLVLEETAPDKGTVFLIKIPCAARKPVGGE